jgi:hypothetical protein
MSTRRLRARLAGVSLAATGSASALPSERMRAGSTSVVSAPFTASARAADRCQFDG